LPIELGITGLDLALLPWRGRLEQGPIGFKVQQRRPIEAALVQGSGRC